MGTLAEESVWAGELLSAVGMVTLTRYLPSLLFPDPPSHRVLPQPAALFVKESIQGLFPWGM